MVALTIRKDRTAAVLAAPGAVGERCARVAAASGDCQCAFQHGPEGCRRSGGIGPPIAAGLDHPLQCGVEGLRDRWGKGRSGRLKPDEQAELAAITLRGPDPEAEGISAYTLEDLAHLTQERFGKPFHPASMSRVVRRLGFSRQKARPSHPLNDPAEAEAFKKSPGIAQ
jgi:transposase